MSTLPEKSSESRFSGQYSKNVFSTLWFAYRSSAPWLALLFLFGLLGRMALLANANMVGYWVDTFCRSSAEVHCRPLPSVFQNFGAEDFVHVLTALTIGGFVFSLLFRIGFSVISARAVSNIYDETTYRTSRYPMSFFDNHPAGRIVTRFSSDYGNVFRLFGGPLAEFLSIVFDMISMVVLIGVASPFYLPAILLVAAFNYLIYRLNRDRLRTSRRELSASRSPSVAHFAETVQGASTIRTFNRENSFADRFSRLDRYFLEQKIRVVRNIMQFSFQMNSLTALLLLLTGVGAFYFIKNGLVSVGSLGVAFGFIALSGNTVQMFFEWLAQFEEAMIGMERLDQYLRLPIEAGAKLPLEAKFPTDHWKQGSPSTTVNSFAKARSVDVELRNLQFRYAPHLPLVLKNISFKVKAGQKLGVVGRTGSGKSSLIQALLSLYPIESGEIFIDGHRVQMSDANPIRSDEVDLEKFRQAVSFIAQDPILFKTTLRDNLVSDARFPNDLIFAALRKVGLDHWANEEGLRKAIEEKGKNLSLGEKQLICMARCLLQSCPVVIMDEATSSVDPKSEEVMVRATRDFFADRTQIIIAHRLSTLQNCDVILWLQDGRIVEFGSPHQVLPHFQATDLSFAEGKGEDSV